MSGWGNHSEYGGVERTGHGIALTLLIILALGAVLFTVRAGAEDQHQPSPARPDSRTCEAWAEHSPERVGPTGCVKCRPGYVIKSGTCLQAGDFGPGRRELVPPRDHTPIQPIR